MITAHATCTDGIADSCAGPFLPNDGIHGLAEERGRVEHVQRGHEPRRRDRDELDREAPQRRERDDVADRRVLRRGGGTRATAGTASSTGCARSRSRRCTPGSAASLFRNRCCSAAFAREVQHAFEVPDAVGRRRSRRRPSPPRSCRRRATARRAPARSRARAANAPAPAIQRRRATCAPRRPAVPTTAPASTATSHGIHVSAMRPPPRSRTRASHVHAQQLERAART